MKNRSSLFAGLFLVLLTLNVAYAAARITDTPRVPAVGIASVYSGSAPGANTDILATDVNPEHDYTLFRVTICLATSSVFNVTTDDGTTAYTNGLNSSVALNAGDMYTFVFSTRQGIGYNFQVETDGVIRFLYVEEVIQETSY